MTYDHLFREVRLAGNTVRLATVPTEDGHERLILGSPVVLSDEEFKKIGTSVPNLSNIDERVIGTEGFLDFERSVANDVEINGHLYSFPIYAIRHLAVPDGARGRRHGTRLLESIASIARKEHRHLAGNPSESGQGLCESFSKSERGAVWYREAENPMILMLLRYDT